MRIRLTLSLAHIGTPRFSPWTVASNNFAARLRRRRICGAPCGGRLANEASDFAAVLIRALSAPYELDGIEVVIGASIGIALSRGTGQPAKH